MKRFQIIVEMDDDAPEGSALLQALGGLVQRVPEAVSQKSMRFRSRFDLSTMIVKCKWMPPKEGEADDHKPAKFMA